MNLLRPQNVAATSVRTVGGTTRRGPWLAKRPPSGTLPGWALAVAVWVALCVASSAAGASAETHAPVVHLLERSVLAKMNGVRRQHGLLPLRFSTGLASAARHHSREMAEDGYFRHNSADGEAFGRRIARFYPIANYHYWSLGEIMLWSSGELDATAALKLWLGSPEHRAVMLRARYRRLAWGRCTLARPQAFTVVSTSRSSPPTSASAANGCERSQGRSQIEPRGGSSPLIRIAVFRGLAADQGVPEGRTITR